MTNWLLPDGFEEILPDEARRLEQLQSTLMRLLRSWGYQRVGTPLAEYLDSLLSGVGRDLDLLTCKITDQLTGKLMGIRADMTPQIARMDAHHIADDLVSRYAYTGPVLRSRPSGAGEPREVLQIGAELFGYSGEEADLEILELMASLLNESDISDITLDLGHVGLFRSLCAEARLNPAQEKDYFDVLQSKSESDMQTFLADLGVSTALKKQLGGLADLHGGVEVIQLARDLLGSDKPTVNSALDSLENIVARISEYWDEQHLYIDLAELRGYRYHTGIVFSAYVPGEGAAIARGGRYDNIGAAFGKPRPAIGFSADLRKLLSLGGQNDTSVKGVAVNYPVDRDTAARVSELRAQGETVIYWLPGIAQEDIRRQCDRILDSEDNALLVKNF